MTARWLISGRVQGVGFRAFVARHGQELGLTGHVKNLPDGRVEVVARGSESAVAALRELVAGGPRMARVANVENTEISDDMRVYNSFTIM